MFFRGKNAQNSQGVGMSTKQISKTKSHGKTGKSGRRTTENSVTAKRKTKVAAKPKPDLPTLPRLPASKQSESDQLIDAGETIAREFAEWRSKQTNQVKVAVNKSVYASKLRDIGLPNGNAILTSAVEAFTNEQETAQQIGSKQAVERAEKAQRQTPEILAEAARILHAPSIIDEMLATTTQMGHVREEPMRTLVFLSVVAGLTARSHKDAIHLILKGPSSGGKNAVLNRVLDLFPRSTALILTSATEAAFTYAETVPVLVFQEIGGQKSADYIVRQIMSEGLVTRSIAFRNLSAVYKTSVITTTTLPFIHKENETRAFSMTVSHDPELTREIMVAEAHAAAGEPRPKVGDDHLLAWHEAMSQLAVGEVVVPFPIASELVELFPREELRSRRDLPRAVNLVKACALLHQHQRERDSNGRMIAVADDYEMIKPILEAFEDVDAPVSTVQGEAINTLLHELFAKSPDGSVRRMDLITQAAAMGIASEKTVRTWGKRFEEMGLIKSSGAGGRLYYHLVSRKAAV